MNEDTENHPCAQNEESMTMCTRKELINAWCRSVGVMHIAHHVAASSYAMWHRWFGSLSAFLAALVGTSIFASLLDNDINTQMKIAAGSLSLLSAALTGAVTFLKLDQRARRHLDAAADFQRLRRDMEEERIMFEECKSSVNYEDFKERWHSVLRSSLPLPQRIHDEVNKNFEKKYNKSALCGNFIKVVDDK